MSSHLLDLVAPQDPHESGKVYGVVIGIVTNNKDPDKLGRVKVRFPWLSDTEESWWARIATMVAGPDRGSYFLPEVDDEVLVAFDHGDVRFPYVIGALWNGRDAPPENNSDGENNLRVIRSRNGHVLKFDDTQSSEKVEVVSKSGHIVRLDDQSGDEKIEVIDKNSRNKITIKSTDNSITIECDGKLTIKANGIDISSLTDVKIQANTEMKLQANVNVSVSGSAMVKIDGGLVKVN
jgi:uncharacterized protein involved in type VI secretion and phage assembly